MSVSYKDYYKLLGVSKNANKEEIDKAYKKLARKHHPDLNKDDPTAEEKFKDINEAHEVLKDPEKRRYYDQLGPNWKDGQNFQNSGGFGGFGGFGQGGFSGSGDFSDFFEMLFRQQGGGFNSQSFNRQRRGQDVEATMHIALEDVIKGGHHSINLNTSAGPKNLKVNIPVGIKNGGKLRLTGQGGNGSPNGDLYLIIEYAKHSQFKVDGSDITVEIPVLPWEAVLGTKVEVPTLDGKVEMNVPAGISSGRKLRLKGKGLGSPDNRGDEYVLINIKSPDLSTMTEKSKALWQELADEAQKGE